MKILNLKYKIIVQILFVIIFLFTSSAKSLDKFEKADLVSDYFSGILLLNDNQYQSSFEFLKKLNGLESSHINFSVKYFFSLINSGNLREAFNYSKRLEKQKLDSFESNLISGIYYLKKSNMDKAKKYFLKAKNINSGSILNNYILDSLYIWSNLSDLNKATLELKNLDQRFDNLIKIQNVFLNCHFDSPDTINNFNAITLNQEINFSRYNYFYASYIASTGEINNAKKIINSALKLYPRNLLLNQYKLDLNENKNIELFNCKKVDHVIAEILYVAANALSSQ